MSLITLPKKEMRWTPKLIRRLRGNRSPVELALLLESSAEEVLLWESGHLEPDARQSQKLSGLAEREQFLKNWKLAGSGSLLIDLEAASQRQAEELRQTLNDRTRRLQE